jgi:hypothetical protein
MGACCRENTEKNTGRRLLAESDNKVRVFWGTESLTMRLVLIGMLLLLIGLWLPVLAYSQSSGRPARSGARRRDPSAADSHV